MNKFSVIGIVAAVLLVGGGAAYYFLVVTAETDGAEPAPKVDDRAFIYVEIPPGVANFDVRGKCGMFRSRRAYKLVTQILAKRSRTTFL